VHIRDYQFALAAIRPPAIIEEDNAVMMQSVFDGAKLT